MNAMLTSVEASPPANWEANPLKGLVAFEKGHVVATTSHAGEGSIPYIGADSFGGRFSQFTDDKGATTCDPSDVLMLWDGERSGLCASGLRGAIGSTVARLRPRDGVNGRFLYYQLARHFDWIQARRTGTGVPHVPKDLASLLRVPVPNEKNEQLRIAAVLDTVDEAIAKTEAVIAKLRQVRAGLLHDLLTRGLDKNGQLRDPIAHPEQFQDSSLGSVPKEWQVWALRDCLIGNAQNGIYKPAGSIGRGTLLIGQTSITEDRSLDVKLARRAEVTEQERERYGLRTGDILVSRVFATLEGVGQPALVPSLSEVAVYESNMMRLRPRPQALASTLLFHWLRTPRIRSLITSRVNLSNQASVNQQALLPLPVMLPSPKEQKAMLVMIENQDDCRRAHSGELAKLKALKSGLMTDLLTGRVRVPEEGADGG